MKKYRSKYKINIQGLDEKRHEFSFDGDDQFFASFEDQDIIDKGNFTADLIVEKSTTMLRVHFKIEADIALVCDRSLEEYTEHFSIDEHYIYKFGDRFEVVSEDMEIIAFGEAEINVSQNLFDYLCLAVPMKRIHPDYREDADFELDSEYSPLEDEEIEEEEESKDDTQEIDPRWAALKNLKKE